jgi:hypothetical protein
MLGTPDDDYETVRAIFREPIAVGLGKDMGYGHLRLDPALPAYLMGQMTPAEQAGDSVPLGRGDAGSARLLEPAAIPRHSNGGAVDAPGAA